MFKIRGKFGNVLTDVENPLYNQKTQTLKLRYYFTKRNFDTESKISFVGTMDISSYTQSEQPRVAGKQQTRLAQNGMAVVTCIATLLRWPPSFWKGRQTLSRSLDVTMSSANEHNVIVFSASPNLGKTPTLKTVIQLHGLQCPE